VTNVTQFRTDLTNSNSAAITLANYLQGVPKTSVLIGVTTGQATLQLSSALSALSAMGVTANDVQSTGSFSFVTQTESNMTLLNKLITSADKTSSMMNAVLLGTVQHSVYVA